MTKRSPATRPRAKAVEAWAVHDGYGNILPNTVRADRGAVANTYAAAYQPQTEIICVRIAPVAKGRK